MTTKTRTDKPEDVILRKAGFRHPPIVPRTPRYGDNFFIQAQRVADMLLRRGERERHYAMLERRVQEHMRQSYLPQTDTHMRPYHDQPIPEVREITYSEAERHYLHYLRAYGAGDITLTQQRYIARGQELRCYLDAQRLVELERLCNSELIDR